MDYRTFTGRGAAHWDETERLLADVRRGGLKRLDHEALERLAAGHRRVVSDFAFARTHFSGSEAAQRLRGLAFTGHRLLARREERVLRRLGRFFTSGYPQVFRESLPVIGIAVLIFLGAALLGAVITLVRPEFATLFLDAQRLEQLRDGKLWTDEITRVAPESVLSSQILSNNIAVALTVWAGGALFGLLTIYLLLLNGVMLGCVAALTWHHGLLERLAVWLAAHGPLELFLITVAAAGGLMLAQGALVTGNRSRAESFARAARRSLRLVAGTVPWFVVLGLVEGYVSTAEAIPLAVKAATGWAMLAAFLAWGLSSRGPSREDRR